MKKVIINRLADNLKTARCLVVPVWMTNGRVTFRDALMFLRNNPETVREGLTPERLAAMIASVKGFIGRGEELHDES